MKSIATFLVNNRVALGALALGAVSLAVSGPSFAVDTLAVPDWSAAVVSTKGEFLNVLAQGAPAAFVLMGVTSGIGWVWHKVRSVAH